MKLPSWNSTTAKTLRTAIYEVAILLLALLANPEIIEFLTKNYPDLVFILTAGPVVLTFIVNFLSKSSDNY